jgi:ATP-dependent Clp protease ATP-binding subunit ClpC
MMLNFSQGVQLACRIAAGEAIQSRHQFVDPEHFFIGICKFARLAQANEFGQREIPPDVAAALRSEALVTGSILKRFGIGSSAVYRELRQRKGQGDFEHPARASLQRSPLSRTVFEQAAKVAGEGSAVTVPHLLAALLGEHGPVVTFLREKGVDVVAMEAAARAASPRPGQAFADPGLPRGEGDGLAAPPAMPGFLQRFAKDLTQLARDGKIHECIGRRQEMLKVIRALCRDTKNNPLLLGDAGVGKTAIVEGLAWRIARNKDPALSGKRILQLNVADLVAGTKHRGDFEERIQGLLRETAASPNLILFIDEIHSIVGAGGGGALDAASIIKPALARGELRCIGTTTLEEFRKHIEIDAALERRFQPIQIGEPTISEALEILSQGYQKRFGENHGVTIEPAAVEAAVTLSARYLPNRRLPDKAIDLLDQACAHVAVPMLSGPPGLEPADGIVTAETVARVIAEWTGIPVGQMTGREQDRLLRLAEELKQRVIGQDRACDAVAQAIQRERAGLKAPGRPVAVLLFVGPTGVGKTELAKSVSALLFGSEKAMVRLDMSEYQEKHTVARLIGAPPGYIGHDEEGQLTGALRRQPHCLVLLDEVEKAHADVLNVFLQVFDDGRLTDSRGRAADATNAMFVLTCNVPPNPPVGFNPEDTELRSRSALAEVRKMFRPELFNRFDEVIVFDPLRSEQAKHIAQLLLRGLTQRLKEQSISLEVTDEALQWICRLGFDASSGARQLRHVLQQEIENRIADKILHHELKPGHCVLIDLKEGQLLFEATDSHSTL